MSNGQTTPNAALASRFDQMFPVLSAAEIYQVPRSWTERAYHKLIYYHQADKGWPFAAWEQPELFAAELRAAFKSLRKAELGQS